MSDRKAAAIAAFEAGGAALALGYYHGRKGEMPEKFKIPLDAAAGVGLTLLGLFGGKYIGGESVAKHLTATGTGALSYFFGSLGGQFGQKARWKAGEMKGPGGPYLTGNDKIAGDASQYGVDDKGNPQYWRNSRTITAGAPVAGPAHAYGHAWRR